MTRVHITVLAVAVVLAGAAAGLGGHTEPAQAACGGVRAATPKPRKRDGRLVPLAIGVRLVARRFPRRVRLLDWARHSRGHGRWFGGDGLHLTFAGRRALTRLLSRALRFRPPPRGRRSRQDPVAA